jgi:DNA-binding response OmpR family regulator
MLPRCLAVVAGACRTGLADVQIIVADDSEVTRRILAATLVRAGHDVVAAADGEAAWTAFERLRPPMLILDWQMPIMDGLDVCRRIRQTPGGTDVFVLMVTGRDATNHLGDALDAGVDDYLAKPVTPDHLTARVRIAERCIAQTLARRGAEAALARAQWLAGVGETRRALEHEIYNPLTAVLGHAQLLTIDPEATPGIREQAAAMIESGRRIEDVVRRLHELDQPLVNASIAHAPMLELGGPLGSMR